MGDYRPIARQRARRPALFSAEGAQWRQYRQPLTLSLKAAPTHVEFSPVSPHDVAVASSLQVDVFSTQTHSLYRTLTRFKDVVHCASYRADGKVLAAGDERGATQLFDLGSRAVMRTFHGHSRAVHAARFSPHGPQLYTASDDATAKCWDVVAEAEVRCFEGHTDFVRSAAVGGGAAQLLLTGSYDHTVVLWDVHAAGGGVMTLRHAAPVEAVVALPGGGLVATASGATLTLWDILSGGRVLHSVSAHSKTITSLCADADGAHLLSASLDRMVKVYDLSTCAVVASLKYAAPLLALALSPSGSDLVVGQSDSTLCVRTRKSAAPPPPPSDEPYGPRGGRLPGQVVDPPRREGARPGTYRYFLRGRQHAPQPADRVVEPSAAPRLSTFDKALKSFRYHEAFDAALKDGSPEVVVSVVEELVQRNGLRIALQGRDHHTLQPVVAFLARQITSPPYSQVLIGVANLLLDMYAPVLGQSPAIDELFVKLRNVLEAEVRLQAELAQLMGAMDVLLAGAMPTWTALSPDASRPHKQQKAAAAPSDS
ncbi:hypothetical protein AB1Y20_014774 [Prymnesium parvum]|uniref:U3 small nucleolar RNA-associated protein 15 C-terminal domain-containing protein n=1 Tax=Prymnesium parvum TaxID=97485 RepID=A0AB34ID22_PRYPA